jgi:stress response protein SCP2
LDIGQEVTCSITTTASGNISSEVKPLDTDRLPGLRALLDNAQDESDPGVPSLARLEADLAANPAQPRPPADLYQLTPFAQWKRQAAPAPPQPSHRPTPPAPAPQPSATLVAGQTVVLPEIAQQGLLVSFTFVGPDADLTLLLPRADGLVTGDEDFVFYNQPTAAHGAARLLGKQLEGPYTVERAALHLAALPLQVQRVVVSINMDVDTGLTRGELTHAVLDARCITGATWHFPVPADPSIKAMVVAEFYRHIVDGAPAWKLRAVGQGWADGLGRRPGRAGPCPRRVGCQNDQQVIEAVAA